MSEMLGNQFFMARKYEEAEKELEEALSNNQNSKHIRRKLIICYTQTNKLNQAFSLFYKLAVEDIDFIMSADPILDDCPCPEIVTYLKDNAPEDTKKVLNELKMLGILWLYCDPNKSYKYFKDYLKLDPNDSKIAHLIKLLGSKLDNGNISNDEINYPS